MWALIHDLGDNLAPLTILNLRLRLSGHKCEVESLGSLSIMVFFSFITVLTQWLWIKILAKFIVAINGLIVAKNFLTVGIKCHLISIITPICLHILNSWFMKFLRGHCLTAALSWMRPNL